MHETCVCARYRTIYGCHDIIGSTNPRSISRYRVIDMITIIVMLSQWTVYEINCVLTWKWHYLTRPRPCGCVWQNIIQVCVVFIRVQSLVNCLSSAGRDHSSQRAIIERLSNTIFLAMFILNFVLGNLKTGGEYEQVYQDHSNARGT